ncbi:phosphonate C-P lyase system protein PhnH [Cellulomonas sp. S1-8]|uniref:phosphonate C-P lyase system protein PhnH n=1 Tax=Cellulomonas sp. S1-8 TaxID=2904790 RepID=UPI0022445112|nr:phosphonate C-P lyase system protein PhnH [Cellulomonas sp. S1-8]UZN02883.1 phosphonate C-P lyase system protein PhnH [Cellulomonas sp. S1-8]
MSTSVAHRTPGFAHPVRDAQQVFRAVLEALARPTTAQPVGVVVEPPAPLGATAGAVVLALCDEQTPVWLDPALRAAPAVGAWIAFHTGARVVDEPGDAAFAVVSSPSAAPSLGDLAQGTDEEPHRSATLVIDTSGAHGTQALVATGPGIPEVATWDGAGLPPGFLAQWQANHALFPRGVDVLLAAGTTVRGLPRTTALSDAHEHAHEHADDERGDA